VLVLRTLAHPERGYGPEIRLPPTRRPGHSSSLAPVCEGYRLSGRAFGGGGRILPMAMALSVKRRSE